MAEPWSADFEEHPHHVTLCAYPATPYWFWHEGILCNAKRGPMLHWNGYVYIPPGHPCYDNGDTILQAIDDVSRVDFLSMHELNGIEYYQIAFSYTHWAHDIVPGHQGLAQPEATYKDYNFVRAQLIDVAEQLLAVQADVEVGVALG